MYRCKTAPRLPRFCQIQIYNFKKLDDTKISILMLSIKSRLRHFIWRFKLLQKIGVHFFQLSAKMAKIYIIGIMTNEKKT